MNKTFGRVTVDMHGIRSIPEACALHACINGLRRSAFVVDAGRRILIGMRSETEGRKGIHKSGVLAK
jgi:hypothetical protein